MGKVMEHTFKTILTDEPFEAMTRQTNHRALKILEIILWGHSVRLGNHLVRAFETDEGGFALGSVSEKNNTFMGLPDLSLMDFTHWCNLISDEEYEEILTSYAFSRTASKG